MQTKTPKEVLREWVAAYNNRDPFALIELYADDAEVDQVAFNAAPLRGREALLASFVDFFTAFPDNYTNPENVFTDGEWTIIEWSGGGTFLGNLGEMPPTGKSFKLRGCGFLRIVNGKIVFQRGYFDKQTWFSQIEAPINSRH